MPTKLPKHTYVVQLILLLAHYRAPIKHYQGDGRYTHQVFGLEPCNYYPNTNTITRSFQEKLQHEDLKV